MSALELLRHGRDERGSGAGREGAWASTANIHTQRYIDSREELAFSLELARAETEVLSRIAGSAASATADDPLLSRCCCTVCWTYQETNERWIACLSGLGGEGKEALAGDARVS